MQDDGGLKRILTRPWGYLLFKWLIGSGHSGRWVSENFWKPRPGEKVVDIGCGPGTAIRLLPDDIDYVGFDISPDYIEHARALHAGSPRRTFLVGTAEDFVESLPEAMRDADLVIINGVLHHLDDEQAINALRLAHACLSPTGRLVCLENCYLMSQARLARWIVSRDRGRNLRYEAEWKTLFRRVFAEFDTHIMTGLLRIPYTHIIIEARR